MRKNRRALGRRSTRYRRGAAASGGNAKKRHISTTTPDVGRWTLRTLRYKRREAMSERQSGDPVTPITVVRGVRCMCIFITVSSDFTA